MSYPGRPLKRTAAVVLALTVLFWGISIAAEAGQKSAGQPAVYIFTQDFCPACLGAEAWFRQQGIRFAEFNIEHNARARSVFERLGGRGTPLILVGGQPMTGFDPDVFRRLMRQARARQ